MTTRQESRQADSNRLSRRARLVPLIILVAGLAVYANSFHGPFVFDDMVHIRGNPKIHRLWPIGPLVTSTSRPLVMVSLAVNHAFGGYDVRGYHAFNLAVHLLAALALYGVVRRSLQRPRLRERFGRQANTLATAAALVWTVHPVQTESVTYLIQRAEALMGMFSLFSLYCLLRGAEGRREHGWYGLALVSVMLGTLCKPTIVVTPLVILVFDRLLLGRTWAEIGRRRGWLYGGLVATWLIIPLLLAQAPEDWQASAGYASGQVTVAEFLRTQPQVILHYLRLVFWPQPLCLDYAWPVAREPGAIVVSAVVVGLLVAGTVWRCWRHAPVGVLGAWFFLYLAPTSSVIPIADLAVEHRLYLPLAAMVVLVTVGGQRFLASCGARPVGQVIALGVLVAGLGGLTVRRNADYRSELTVWTDTVAKRPRNPRARYQLGSILAAQGRWSEAAEQYGEAIRLAPEWAVAYNQLGLALAALGEPAKAIRAYERAAQLDPKEPMPLINHGAALAAQRKLTEAVAKYEEALGRRPDSADAHNNLASALAALGRTGLAIEHYRAALRSNPDLWAAHCGLGVLLARRGETTEARVHLQRALELKPDDPRAHRELKDLENQPAGRKPGDTAP